MYKKRENGNNYTVEIHEISMKNGRVQKDGSTNVFLDGSNKLKNGVK